jgi:hypothetical protein
MLESLYHVTAKLTCTAVVTPVTGAYQLLLLLYARPAVTCGHGAVVAVALPLAAAAAHLLLLQLDSATL